MVKRLHSTVPEGRVHTGENRHTARQLPDLSFLERGDDKVA